MRSIATYLWSLAAAAAMTAIGLASSLGWAVVATMAFTGAAAVFSFLGWWTSPARRVFLEDGVTPKFLTSLPAGRTSIQAEQAVSLYLRKWITVSGSIRDVSYVPGIRKVNVLIAGPPIILLYFGRAKAKISVLHIGDHVTVQGRIESIDSGSISLNRCELLGVGPTTGAADPGPSPSAPAQSG